MIVCIFVFFRGKQVYDTKFNLHVETLQTVFCAKKEIIIPYFLGAEDVIISFFFRSRPAKRVLNETHN